MVAQLKDPETLFDRLGGRVAVDAAVEIFYGRVLADPTINHFFKGVPMQRQIMKQKAFLTFVFGGAPNYSGKSMREAHKHLNLTEEHFTAVASHLHTTLVALSVPDNLIDEVMALAATTHDDVLNL